jgi:hypothetical protein
MTSPKTLPGGEAAGPAPRSAAPTEPPPGASDHPSLGWGPSLIVLGVLWLLAVSPLDVTWGLVLPVSIIVVGLLVLVMGPRGAADGLVGLGIVLSVVALTVALLPVPTSLSAGDRTHRPPDLALLETEHALGAGSLTVDLRELDLEAGVTDLSARVTFGELVVKVPEGAVLAGAAQVSFGEISALGREQAGVAPSLQFDSATDADGAVLRLDLQVGFGRIEVTR